MPDPFVRRLRARMHIPGEVGLNSTGLGRSHSQMQQNIICGGWSFRALNFRITSSQNILCVPCFTFLIFPFSSSHSSFSAPHHLPYLCSWLSPLPPNSSPSAPFDSSRDQAGWLRDAGRKRLGVSSSLDRQSSSCDIKGRHSRRFVGGWPYPCWPI